MKKLLATILIALMLAIGGCSSKQLKYSADLALINNDLMILEDRYEMVTGIAKSKWDKLSVEEQANLKIIDGNVKMIFAKMSQLKSVEAYNVTVADIGYMYTLAKDSYFMAKIIVDSHMSELTSSELMLIRLYDQQLQQLDRKVQDLMQNPDHADINNTLLSTLALGGVALKLLVPVFLGL